MEPNLEKVESKAQEVLSKYNPKSITPFPYRNITNEIKNIKFIFTELEEALSGAIIYNDENKVFTIFVNSNKSETRQHFTLAHELGHYFLHKDRIKEEGSVLDGDPYDGNKAFFRWDEGERNTIETEANNFAASLIMPKDLVIKAWREIDNIEDMAKIFEVSAIAMTIRLERLGLIPS